MCHRGQQAPQAKVGGHFQNEEEPGAKREPELEVEMTRLLAFVMVTSQKDWCWSTDANVCSQSLCPDTMVMQDEVDMASHGVDWQE